ncbi:MAG TPA: hypothetical protein VGR71_05715 [Nitrospira sp.]|nr:hypothetical protein [Nitrospira sp.]
MLPTASKPATEQQATILSAQLLEVGPIRRIHGSPGLSDKRKDLKFDSNLQTSRIGTGGAPLAVGQPHHRFQQALARETSDPQAAI